ncbi:unnamed protein product, partial [Rotaria sp. Silwood2]
MSVIVDAWNSSMNSQTRFAAPCASP